MALKEPHIPVSMPCAPSPGSQPGWSSLTNKMWQKWYSSSSRPESQEDPTASALGLLGALRCNVRCQAPCEKAIQRVRNPKTVKRDPATLSSRLSSAPNRSARWMQPQEWPLARPAEKTPSWAQTRSKSCEQIKWLLCEASEFWVVY